MFCRTFRTPLRTVLPFCCIYANTTCYKRKFNKISRCGPNIREFQYKILWTLPVVYTTYCLRMQVLRSADYSEPHPGPRATRLPRAGLAPAARRSWVGQDGCSAKLRRKGYREPVTKAHDRQRSMQCRLHRILNEGVANVLRRLQIRERIWRMDSALPKMCRCHKLWQEIQHMRPVYRPTYGPGGPQYGWSRQPSPPPPSMTRKGGGSLKTALKWGVRLGALGLGAALIF